MNKTINKTSNSIYFKTKIYFVVIDSLPFKYEKLLNYNFLKIITLVENN